MVERPILFSAPMVRALLAGTKTQTRRVVKGSNFVSAGGAPLNFAGSEIREVPCPYGWIGDRLWVREAHSIGPGPGVPLEPGETAGALRWPHVTYGADGAVERRDTRWKGAFGVGRPSIHMPRWASRITLEVTEVRVERLQAISEADALAEGVDMQQPITLPFSSSMPWATATMKPRCAVDAYAALWAEINSAASWNANPWVWVVSFKVIAP